MPPMNRLAAGFLPLLLCPAMTCGQGAGVSAEEFVRIPPKSPGEERRHLHVKPGFRLELVASEPQVADPVALCFDERGRLFVAELHDHLHSPDTRHSRIKLLTDPDGDGHFEKAIVFADNLPWITAIAPWDGGVLVGSSPELQFFKDTDGDGKADVRETILRGFDQNEAGETVESFHHERSLNNLNWGPDNRYYCAAGLNGGFVRNLARRGLGPMVLRKLDFSYDPLRRDARPETGSSQHGLALDDWGNRYQTTNSNPALFPSYDLRYRLRNPGAQLPTPMASISRPSPKGPVFRRSRTEPWREARTRLRAAGVERGPVEEGGTVSGYFTGTADGAIYRGGLFPEEYHGSLFVGEVSENVVHRKRIVFPADRVEPDALRPADEQDYEFLASSDNWFRPTQITNGPGGALYICDMYRELIEAWHTIPEYIREHLDQDSGRDRGRIWRLVPENAPATGPVEILADLETAELVGRLATARGWELDTAARLLYARQDESAVPLLEQLLAGDVPPLTTFRALHALDGLGALKPEHVLPGLESGEAWLRIATLRLAERLHRNGADIPLPRLAPLADDPDPRVLYQLAFTLGEFPGPEATPILGRIAGRFPEDEWLALAIAASAGTERLPALFGDLLRGDAEPTAAAHAVAREAGRTGVALPVAFVQSLAESPSSKWAGLLLSYSEGLRAAKRSLSSNLDPATVATLSARCLGDAADASKPDEIRVTSLQLLSQLRIPEPEMLALALPLLRPGTPEPLQDAALAAFRSGIRSREAAGQLVARYPETATRLRASTIQLFLLRPEWRGVLLDAITAGRIQALEIPASAAATLRRDRDPELARRATELLPPPADRKKVVAAFQEALTLPGDTSAGERIFRQRCLVCHQHGDEGGRVGPALGEFRRHGKGQVLLNLLDPNNTVQPDYVASLLETTSGEKILGRVIEDTSASVVLRDATGTEHSVTRESVRSLTTLAASLMPEGIEAGMSAQDMADLLEFIATP